MPRAAMLATPLQLPPNNKQLDHMLPPPCRRGSTHATRAHGLRHQHSRHGCHVRLWLQLQITVWQAAAHHVLYLLQPHCRGKPGVQGPVDAGR
jgi:hypothetical protein